MLEEIRAVLQAKGWKVADLSVKLYPEEDVIRVVVDLANPVLPPPLSRQKTHAA